MHEGSLFEYLFAILTEVNRSVVQAASEEELFNALCRILVQTGKFSASWIGKADLINRKLYYIAYRDTTLEQSSIPRSYEFFANCPTATALRTQSYYRTNDFSKGQWADELKQYIHERGYKSYLIIPFKKGEATHYLLNISSSRDEAFTQPIIRLLMDVREVISHAVENIDREIHNRKAEVHIGKIENSMLTKEKEAQEGFVLAERNIRRMMDLIPLAIFLKDRDGRYVYVNKQYCDLYGQTQENMLGIGWGKVIPPNNNKARIADNDNEIIQSGITVSINDFEFYDAAGERRLFNVIKTPFQWPASSKTDILCILDDITFVKKAAADKSKMLEDLKMRNENLEQFSYIISHNLRAPVANIQGAAKALRIEGLPKADQSDLLNGIIDAANKTDAILKDLNTILYIRNTSLRYETVVFDEILKEVTTVLDLEIRQSQATINTDFAETGQLHSVRAYLYDIFYNMVSNSIKYRQKNVPPVIDIYSKSSRTGTDIIFKDNGIGFDMEKYGDQIFGLYNRFHTDAADGNGVGLFLVKTQVETLKGSITVASAVNAGATFRIRFKNNVIGSR